MAKADSIGQFFLRDIKLQAERYPATKIEPVVVEPEVADDAA
jgi:hypothetical protein